MIKGVNGIHHVALSVPDMKKAHEFYSDLLGFEKVGGNDFSWGEGSEGPDRVLRLKNSAANYSMLKAGNIYLELFEFSSPKQPAQDPDKPVSTYGYTHFAFDVTGIEDLYRRLVAAGMDFHTEPQHFTGVSSTYGRDPFGNVIELQEIHDVNALPGI
jgi:catechol 2,3-dioxygenase-like lactoylglutathione lyase family enzyme